MSNETGQPKIPQARSRLQEPAQVSDPDFDDIGSSGDDKIQKGMPARNIKMGLSAIAAAVLLVYLLFPRDQNKPLVEQPPPPAPVATGNLVEDLVRAKPEPQPIAPAPAPPPTSFIPPVPTPEQPSLEDERKLAALLASTEGTDVILRNRNIGTPRPTDIPSLIASNQERADQMMAESQEFARKMVEQSTSAAGQSASAATVSAPVQQSAHARFLSTQAQGGPLGPAIQLDAARSRHSLYEGTIIRTVLTRALKTDLPGMVTAKVTTDLYDTVTQRVLLVPRGSEITCAYQSELMIGQELVLAACNRLRLPNGKSFTLNAATASDMQGASGLPAEINNHFWKMFKTALIVGAASKLLPTEDRQISTNQGSSGYISTGGTLLGTAINKIIETTLARNIIISPTGTVDIGTPFTLTISRDVELEPYLR